jgi:hypothetical protein
MIAIQLSRLEAPKIAITQRVKIADRLGEQQELGGHASSRNPISTDGVPDCARTTSVS